MWLIFLTECDTDIFEDLAWESLTMLDMVFLQKLIDYGLHINTRRWQGRTPLFRMAHWNNESFARFLLENGADVQAEDDKGKTALHVAARPEPSLVLPVLIEYGASLNVRD